MTEIKQKPFTKVTTLDEVDYRVILALAENNMRATETACVMHRNRNGILYRIGKIKRITGLDPMNFYDLCKLVEMARKDNR
jgi:sugar diacid utilization regulator